MAPVRLPVEEQKLEIIFLALIILLIVLFLGAVIFTAICWPVPADMEDGQRNSLAAG